MFIYPGYYRRFGIRRLDQITEPPSVPLDMLTIPRASIVHYLNTGSSVIEPREDEYLFREVRKPIPTGFPVELTSYRGNPRVIPFNVRAATKDYYLENRRYRRLVDAKALEADPNTIILYSYSMMGRNLRYIQQPLSVYDRWYNVAKSSWDHIGKCLKDSERQQFVVMNLPTTLVSPATLNRFSSEMSIMGLKYFTTPDDFMFLELWKWLTEFRNRSIISAVDPKDHHKLNIIFIDKNSWFVLNLGKFDEFRRSLPDEEIADERLRNKGQKPITIAKFFLRGVMDIVANRNVSIDEVKKKYEETQVEDDTGTVEQGSLLDSTKEATEEEEKELSRLRAFQANQARRYGEAGSASPIAPDGEDEEVYTNRIARKLKSLDVSRQFDDQDSVPELDDVELEELESQLDEDFSVLALLEKKKEEESEEESQGSVTKPITPPVLGDAADHLMRLCEEYADAGVLTGSEYNRLAKLASKYKEITLDNGETLEKFSQIDPEQLALPPVNRHIDIGGVTDPKMIGSTLDSFDSKYIKEVLDKDVVRMVIGTQQGGLAISDFKVEEKRDVSGAFKEYAVRVVPIKGQPTTLRFSLPIVDEFGRFQSGGTTYRLRKQQGVALPIKKIDQRSVALTSYYGKYFIRKPTVKVADYGAWLCNQIRLKEIREEGITRLDPTANFNERFKCPMVYGYLAKEIGSFDYTVSGTLFHFSFGLNQRETVYGEKALKELEVGGAVLIAKASDTDYLVMTPSNKIRRVTNGQYSELGYLEDILDLPTEKAPIEYTELSVMGREIPIGFLLGAHFGIDWLLKRFNPEYRTAERGGRLGLMKDEYALRFADKTLILNRRDVFNTLLFGGFHKYRNQIRNYTLAEMNDPAVYASILEDMSINYRVLAEVDRMHRLFVDPITEELLIEMKEPILFYELLIRATEMLVDTHVPKVKDRFRGYERFAGAVYHTIVESIRDHENRFGRERSQLDFNPFAVQNAILTDSAKMMVTEINPIEDLKQVEAVSYSGTGGRANRSVTRGDRVYVEEDMGVISEATVDNDKVAVNAYLTANPKLTNLRGIVGDFNLEEDGVASLVSTSMLVSPGADRDDGKRVRDCALWM